MCCRSQGHYLGVGRGVVQSLATVMPCCDNASGGIYDHRADRDITGGTRFGRAGKCHLHHVEIELLSVH
jgi:hypothetical protein